MVVRTHILKTKNNEDYYAIMMELAGDVSAKHIMAINPRQGEYLKLKDETIIDSFVSDEEWVLEAQSFSTKIYAGHSHRPLKDIPCEYYDAVLVCEDMAYVDDCDAMFRQYFRILKQTGVLIGGLWNISYADNIDSLISGISVSHDSRLCGTSMIPLDAMLSRLRELGFRQADIHRLMGSRVDAEVYAKVSRKNIDPVPLEVFNTKINFICAYK